MAGSKRNGTLRPDWITPTLVVGSILVAWTVLAALLEGRHLIPYPWVLAQQFGTDGALLLANLGPTLAVAAKGFLGGVIAVIPLAIIAILAPIAEPIVMRVAIVVHVIPFVAIAPILIVALPGESARVGIAALQVYFPLLIGLLLGLRSTDERTLDVVTASGGRNFARLRYVRIASALPSLISGLQIALPAAILGALIAEFFGADRGLGAILVNAQDSLLTERVWAIALTVGALAAAGYGLITMIARIAVPWAGKGNSVSASVAGTETGHLSTGQVAAGGVAATVLLIGFWQSLRPVFGFDSFFVKDPLEVLRFLFEGNPITGTPASAFWGTFFEALGETSVHASVGFVVGTALAILGAVMLVAVPGLERAVMPFAVVLRSIPLVALTPLIVLIFGRGLLGVTVLVTLVTFFPTLVTVIMGLRAAPDGALDVIRASGGSAFSAARRVRLLYAIPAITASARVAVPAAVAGATLAEWLATGNGLGQLLTLSSVQADYFTLWAGGVLLVCVVLVLYSVIGIVDKAVSARLGVDM
jgi:ABC-type nitrate/sulfonate/bicarbonate transport system permease component